MPGQERQPQGGAADQGLLYDAAYYRQHCGPIPYGRSRHWFEFFGRIADTLNRSLKPRRVFDAGCAWGLLVEAFHDRGVEAWGVDLSSYAIGQVRQDLQPYCRVSSLTEPIEGSFDLIACIEVLEHMPENEANQAIRNLCRATDAILFSSSPSDLTEPTHVNVRPIVSWLRLFSEQGFAPDVVFDASFVSPQAFLLRRRRNPLPIDTLMLFGEKLRIQVEFAAVAQRLEEVYASPGWGMIRRYRDLLTSIRARRPWVFKLFEPVARWFLQRTGGRGTARAAPDPVSLQPVPPPPLAAPPAPSIQTPVLAETASAFSYADWIIEQEPDDAGLAAQRGLAAAFSYQPKISIVVPVYRVPFEIVTEMIASVMGQTYGNWELCLVHADPVATRTRQYFASLAESDQRIKVSLLDENRGISGNSNEALALATGEFIALLDHDDTLAPFALFEIVQALNEDPSIDFLYSDSDIITHPGNQRVNPLLKPQWSPEILLSANYLNHFSVIAAEHVRAIGGWREETDGAQDWDLFLRAIGRGRNVHHIPKILYHWRQIETSVAGGGLATKPYAEEAQLRTVREHCRRQGWSADGDFDAYRRLRILWEHRPGQKISVILVSTAADAETLSYAGRLQTSTACQPAEIVVPLASDISPEDPLIRVVHVPAGASLAERMCRAVDHSTGDIMVFLDQALSPANQDWLSELVGPLQNPEIGIVGAKLLRPDTAEIRHAGVVFTEDHRLEYIFAGEPEDADAEFGAATWYRNWSAVSGACFSLRREVWTAVGGVSGALRYPRLDLDLCLKVQFQAGLRVLYNPFARFFQSRPAALEGWLWNVSQEAADGYIQERFPGGDPYFHSKLTCREGKVRLRSRAGFAAGGTSWRWRSG
jgi:glycosyltransferase involved in cell wall biosynthesis